MRKRFLSILLCLVMLVGILPVQTLAASTAKTLPTPTGLKWGGYSNDVWSYYDTDSGFFMPDICTWNGENLIEVIGDYGVDAKYKLYRKADTSAGSDELIADCTVVMWPKDRSVESTSASELLIFNEYDDSTSNAGHLKSGDYYFTVQYTGDVLRSTVDDFKDLSDSAVAKSPIWHYTQPSQKLSAPTDLSYTSGVLRWTQPGDTSQIAAYVITIADTKSSSLIHLIGDTECSANVLSWLEDSGFDQFTFKVAALSRDIRTIQSSSWSSASAVFNTDTTGSRSASLSGVISGEEHRTINAGINLYLTGDFLDPSQIDGYDAESRTLPAGTNLTNYLLLDTPAAGEFELFNEMPLTQNDQMMAVRIQGGGCMSYQGPVTMTISGKILTSGKDLAVTPSDNCVWNITPEPSPPPTEEGTYDLWFFGTQVTEANRADILGKGDASFDPNTNTLTLRSDKSYGTAGTTPMLKSALDHLTLRVEGKTTLKHQDGFGIEANNLTIQIASPSASLTVIGKTAAFSQTPLNVPEEIFAGANESSAQQKTTWAFGPTTTPYVRLGAHKWQWQWETVFNRGHWLGCSHDGCSASRNAAAHVLVRHTDDPPYGANPGRGHLECQICGYKGPSESLPGTAPNITKDSLLGSEIGMAYQDTIEATGTDPLAWRITSGKLPDGLTLDSKTGEISGKPTKAGTFTFTVQVANQVPGASPAQCSYTLKIDEASNDLRFVKHVTQNALKNADANSRENIENAIYNLIFKAQFKATGSTGKARTAANKIGAKFTGTTKEMSKFPVQNIHSSSSKVQDNVLGTMHFSESGAGCMAYALFATTYTYSYSGKIRICEPTGYKTVKVKDKKGKIVEEKVGQFTAARAKEFILRWADPGEHIRYGAPHSLVFLGEADENGFYCISYGGGARRNHKPNHTLQVEYRTYASIAAKANGSLRIRDANNGSYRNGGSVKKWADVKATKNNKKSKTIIRLHCPVEASVTLDGFILDSEYGPFDRSFGTVERVGDGIVFTLDYSEDLVLDIRGTGEGTMDAEIEYLDESGNSLGSQKFDGMPIAPDTEITSGAMMPESVAVLYYVDDGKYVSAWGANLGETAAEADDELLSINNTPDTEDEEEIPSSGQGDGAPLPAGNISVGSFDNGSVTVSPKTASKGETVTLTIKPDEGYTLETLTVTDKNGNRIELTDKGNGIFTFTMPASEVTVKAAFRKDTSMPNLFVDVSADAYYYDAVLWAAEHGITGGVDDTHFAPDASCTRAQAVTFLWRAAGSPAPKSGAMPFTDVPAGSYYHDAVLWAVEQGITLGTSAAAFSPDAKCTRAQIMTFIYRSVQAQGGGMQGEWMFRNPFDDVDLERYYGEAVMWAVANGITSGTSATTFSPDADCTRAQIVTFLHRCLGGE